MKMNYLERAQLCTNPTAKQLLELMHTKETNLCVAADVTKKADLLTLAQEIGPHICVLKTHIDIVTDFDQDLIKDLVALSQLHNFLIFEDRKFADIGNTVHLQYSEGVYHIADWAQITNAHIIPGPGIIEGLKQTGLPKGNGLLLLAEMSTVGALATGDYTLKNIELAEAHRDFVIGFISQHRLLDDPTMIHMTPGIKMVEGGDALGQQYNTPQTAIQNNGTDVIIVGRAIYQSDDPAAAAKEYRDAGWDAYQTSQT